MQQLEPKRQGAFHHQRKHRTLARQGTLGGAERAITLPGTIRMTSAYQVVDDWAGNYPDR